MSCANIQLNGLSVGCKDNIGGVKEFYIALYENVSGVTVGSDNEITAITMSGTTKFKKYAVRRNSSNFTSTITTDDANGTFSCQTDATLLIAKLDTTNIEEAYALMKADLAVIIRDANDKLFYLGYDNYVTCTASTMQSGTATTDASNISITLTDYSKRPPYLVTEAALAAVL